ncbi:MAG TPA: hydantoinase/oxoprolinase family protein [Desulfitobacteriaceae bacterium]|nr:hydantoinase/oxoprolinase family protein [Desulfitobacteriaceae bacterium]
MNYYVGIDVGGTFTDAVLLAENKIVDKAKIPTNPGDLLHTVMSALEKIDISDKKPVERITVSTTLVTNAILQGKLPKVKLCLFHGYGMKLEALHWPIPYHLLSGVIDYRGREIKAPEQTEWDQLSRDLANDQENITRAAIVGKFSHRNKTHEEQLAAYLREHNPGLQIALGHLWGQANFYRRSLTTYLNLASHDLYRQFAANLQKAVEAEGCSAPISVLKADGGALPLASIRPIDSIFSGPSASVLGALAQNEESESFVVVDIGGTTTDLGIVLSGIPLMSSKGAKIEAFSTLVHSLAVRSVPVGGDSQILKTNQGFALADYRSGPAYCLGGGTPTPTDAMRYLKLVNYGDWVKAEEALASLLPPQNREPADLHKLAKAILETAAEKIALEIEELSKEWQSEPAYKVWEVLHPQEAIKFKIFVSGGGAQGLASFLEKRLQSQVILGSYAEVSNAIGTALAKPTFSWTLQLDTGRKFYQIEETGEQGEWPGSRRPHHEVAPFLTELACKQAAEKGIDQADLQLDNFDYFPIVQGYQTVGQIVRGAIHVPPGVRGRV